MLLGVTTNFVGAQVLTFAIPIGVFFAVCLWGFFERQRRHTDT
jgi:hypothetical protein